MQCTPAETARPLCFCCNASLLTLQDQERQDLNRHLTPLLVPAYDNNGCKRPDSVPEWLQVRGQHEWPDFWVARHQESVVLEVKGDVRCETGSMLCWR
jgi:hypothetical protein